MKKTGILLLFIFMIIGASAQKVLLEENVKEDITKILKGPNLKHFHHAFIDFELIAGQSEDEGADIIPFRSKTLTFGYRYKYKVLRFYSVGFSINLENMIFALKQDSLSKLVPNSTVHDKENLVFNNIGAEIYNRVNFGKRGNQVGTFLDIGVYGNWSFTAKHYTVDDLDATNSSKAGLVEITNKELNYVETVHYGIRWRFGINRFMVSASYRLSNLFNEKYHDELVEVELPKLTIGLQLGLHR